MAAIMSRGRRPRKRAGHMPVNYYVTDRGRDATLEDLGLGVV